MLLLRVPPSVPHAPLVDHLREERAAVLATCRTHGALLFRDWDVASFEDCVEALGLPSYDPTGSAAPRTRVSRTVYTANDAPGNATIPFHHELAQRADPPGYIFFHCVQPAAEGGATPLADSRRVAAYVKRCWPRQHAKLREGVRYTRAMPGEDDPSSPIGRSWRATFGVATRSEAEALLARSSGMRWRWDPEDVLVCTTPLRPALRTVEGEEVFCNAVLAARTGWEDARNAAAGAVRYADGSAVPRAFADDVLAYMRASGVAFRWRAGDLLMVDNAVTLHAREPYRGARRVLAAMRGATFFWGA